MALVLSPVHALEQVERGGSAVERFSDRLQTALNSGNASAFDTLASVDLQPVLVERYQRFRQDFPEVTWQVEPAAPTTDGRPTLSLRVRGVAESEGLTYALEASEEIAIRLDNGQLVEQELLAQRLFNNQVDVVATAGEQLLAQMRPNLPLAPLGGGGLFKSVQAPQQPGSQTWAVMLVHPDGVVTATKRVRVVSSN